MIKQKTRRRITLIFFGWFEILWYGLIGFISGIEAGVEEIKYAWADENEYE